MNGMTAAARMLLAGTLAAAALGLVPEQAHAAYSARVEAGTLTLKGNAASDKLVLRLAPGAPGTLQADVGADGTADFSFDRSTFTAIDVEAGAGDDEVRIDQSGGPFTDEHVTMNGGAGDDTLLGGSGSGELRRRDRRGLRRRQHRRRPGLARGPATTASSGTPATAATPSTARAATTSSTSTAPTHPKRSRSPPGRPRRALPQHRLDHDGPGRTGARQPALPRRHRRRHSRRSRRDRPQARRRRPRLDRRRRRRRGRHRHRRGSDEADRGHLREPGRPPGRSTASAPRPASPAARPRSTTSSSRPSAAPTPPR